MNRWILAFVIIVIVLLLLACVGYMSGRWEAEAEEVGDAISITQFDGFMLASDPCLRMSRERREEVRAILKRAMDQALQEHVEKMYEVWMKDETGQPARARTGTRQGVSAYLRGMESLDKWNEESC